MGDPALSAFLEPMQEMLVIPDNTHHRLRGDHGVLEEAKGFFGWRFLRTMYMAFVHPRLDGGRRLAFSFDYDHKGRPRAKLFLQTASIDSVNFLSRGMYEHRPDGTRYRAGLSGYSHWHGKTEVFGKTYIPGDNSSGCVTFIETKFNWQGANHPERTRAFDLKFDKRWVFVSRCRKVKMYPSAILMPDDVEAPITFVLPPRMWRQRVVQYPQIPPPPVRGTPFVPASNDEVADSELQVPSGWFMANSCDSTVVFVDGQEWTVAEYRTHRACVMADGAAESAILPICDGPSQSDPWV